MEYEQRFDLDSCWKLCWSRAPWPWQSMKAEEPVLLSSPLVAAMPEGERVCLDNIIFNNYTQKRYLHGSQDAKKISGELPE